MLLDTNDVCNYIGISRSTLLRWCNIKDTDMTFKNSRSNRDEYDAADVLFNPFPKPFKIGRSYKWKKEEIDEWLEARRI